MYWGTWVYGTAYHRMPGYRQVGAGDFLMSKVVVVEVHADSSNHTTTAVLAWMSRGLVQGMGRKVGISAQARVYSATMYKLEDPAGWTITSRTHKLVVRTSEGVFHFYQQYGGGWNWTNIGRGV